MLTPEMQIGRYMTRTPHSIGVDQELPFARAMMRRYHIRHLPVLEGGVLVGVLSDRDLALAHTFDKTDSAHVAVADAMSTEVWSVTPETSLQEVVEAMARHKYGCVVVMEHQHVTGIFTTVDVCRAFAMLLSARGGSMPRSEAPPTS